MDNLKHFTDEIFQKEVTDSALPVLVDFWAEWCVPCRHIAPYIAQAADKYAGKLVVGKMDVDSNPVTPSQFGIISIPTLLLFKNGTVIDKRIGALSQKDLEKWLDGNL
jgi:thioredoxin 1